MISESDKETILKISKKYRVKRVLLFGSSLNSKYESNDIDIGVEGFQPEDFFKYYGELMIALSKPVDIVDISGSSKFITLIKTEGIPLYD
jgi:predicted nucleotidyltransferase